MSEIKDMSEIELIPGFKVIEYTPGCTVLDIPSGFRLKIKRLGPYMYGALEEGELKDLGPFKITVRLMEKLQPPGVEQEITYEPPKDENGKVREPDREQFEKEWMYFQQWKAHEKQRAELSMQRGIMRFDMAIANCIEVLDGSISADDAEWLERLVSTGAPEPKNKTQRFLLFFKSQIVTTENARDVILFLMKVEEVTFEGLKQAFDDFRSDMVRR